jgi:hypothetical protein
MIPCNEADGTFLRYAVTDESVIYFFSQLKYTYLSIACKNCSFQWKTCQGVETYTRFQPVYIHYSLRLIILFINIDVSRHILVVDIFIFMKSIMDRRE